jgi:hypothetical protein
MDSAANPPAARGRLAVWLTVSSLLLIAAWLTPDVAADSYHFPWDRLRTAGAWEIAAVLAPPACGSLLLIAVLLPLPFRIRALFGRLVGPVAIVLPLLGALAAVPVPGWIVAIAAVAGAAVGAFLFARSKAALGHLVLAALPAIMIALWLTGLFRGEPAGFLAPFKAPLILFAGMLATAKSAAALLTLSKAPG